VPIFTNNPSISQLVELIKEKERADLYLLRAKGRNRLHDLMDEGNSKMIETIALVDRTFQQRRLLEGQSTQNIASLSKLIDSVQDAGDKSLRSMGIGKDSEPSQR
jgi:hypothetical protein